MSLDLFRLWGAALIGASLAGCASVASNEACDRACLVAATNIYFDALGARAPGSAGLGSAVRMTENGVAASPSSSVFASARPMRWRQVFADPVSGQTSSFARYDDDFLLHLLRSTILRPGVEHETAAVIKSVASHLGYGQVTGAVRNRMEDVFRSGVRRGLLGMSEGKVWKR